MQVKLSIAECSKGGILHYFGPSLDYHLSLTSLFRFFFEWPFNTGFILFGIGWIILECRIKLEAASEVA